MSEAWREGSNEWPLYELFYIIGQRWTLRIVWALRAQPLTYRQIIAEIPGLSASVLTQRLRDLRTANLVRHEGSGYELTGLGNGLLTYLQSLRIWTNKVEFTAGQPLH